MGTYIVGIDDSERAAAALEWTRTVAAPDDTIVVAHAWDLPVFTGYETPQMIDVEPIEAGAREFLETTLRDAGDPRLTGRLVQGPAARALVDLGEQLAGQAADAEKDVEAGAPTSAGRPAPADDDRDESGDAAARPGGDITIVVGHTGSGKVAMLLGSTASYVVHRTSLPVIVVRGEPRLPVRRVVVGVDEHCPKDLTGPSMTAVRWAFGMTGVGQIDVHHAVFVPGVVAGPLSQGPVEADEIHRNAETLLHDTIEAAGGPPANVTVHPEVSHGNANFALIEASRDADLLVVGSRGRGGFRELLLGSTSLAVTAYAHCPVAIVRSAARH